MKKIFTLIALFIACQTASSQTYSDSLIAAHFKRVDKILNILGEFRIQAYIQAQWQKADTAGAASFAGGNFPANANNRFILRRGRFHLTWQHETVTKAGDTVKVGEFVFNFDATEKGFDAIKGFYGKIIDPWTGWFGLQGGIFVRPFGYEQNPGFKETPASGTSESPEFSRMNQTILPNEVELGEALVIESPRTFKPVYVRFDAAAVNGEGVLNTGVGQSAINTGTYQSAKDFMFRGVVGKVFNLGNDTKIGFNAGASYYNGRVLQTTNNVFEVVKNSAGEEVFQNVTAGTADTAGKFHKYYNRDYYEGFLLLNFDYKTGAKSSATTMLRGEFITGQQPGQLSSSIIPLGAGTAVPGVDIYIRKFQGFIAYLTQSFHYKVGKEIMHSEVTFKFDSYNPNTQINGSRLNKTNDFSSTDLAYYTYGFGYTWCPVKYFKLMLWYDHVVNENSGLAGFTSDYRKDDVFTLRTQFMIDTWWFAPKNIYNNNQIERLY